MSSDHEGKPLKRRRRGLTMPVQIVLGAILVLGFCAILLVTFHGQHL